MKLHEVNPENFLDYFNQYFFHEVRKLKNDELSIYLSKLKEKAIDHEAYFIKKNPEKDYQRDCYENRYQQNPLSLIKRWQRCLKLKIRMRYYHDNSVYTIHDSQLHKILQKKIASEQKSDINHKFSG